MKNKVVYRILLGVMCLTLSGCASNDVTSSQGLKRLKFVFLDRAALDQSVRFHGPIAEMPDQWFALVNDESISPFSRISAMYQLCARHLSLDRKLDKVLGIIKRCEIVDPSQIRRITTQAGFLPVAITAENSILWVPVVTADPRYYAVLLLDCDGMVTESDIARYYLAGEGRQVIGGMKVSRAVFMFSSSEEGEDLDSLVGIVHTLAR